MTTLETEVELSNESKFKMILSSVTKFGIVLELRVVEVDVKPSVVDEVSCVEGGAVATLAKYFLANCKCWRLIPRQRDKVINKAIMMRTKTHLLMTKVSEKYQK